MSSLIEIKNLSAKIGDKEILKNLSLKVNYGEVHAIMGPNGSGKSTLSKVLCGHPSCEVTSGEVLYDVNGNMSDLLSVDPEERAREGVFMAFQYPVEVPGVTNFTFLHESYNAILKHQGASALSEGEFREYLHKKLSLVKMNPEYLDRQVNVGFSGGEKKRNEILQMAVLSPRLSLLDETDSGLDIDSLRVVGEGVNKLRSKTNAVVLVTHYQRLLDHIKPDYVHILSDGKIVKTGDSTLALELEKKGYDWLV